MLRFILAFLLAPFPAALLQAILVALWPLWDVIGIYRHPASMFVAMCLVHYALGLVLGLPLYLALRWRSANRLWAYALAGMLMLVPMALSTGWVAAHSAIPRRAGWGMTYAVLRFAAGGLLTGAAFWFLGRPDRREARRRASVATARLSGAFE